MEKINNPIIKGEIEAWLTRQNDALRDVESALERARFCEAQIDRLMEKAGVHMPVEPPQLYVIQGGLA